MSDAAKVAAEAAVSTVAKAAGVTVPPGLVGIAADLFLGALAAVTKVAETHAEREGLVRASKVVDVVSAEAAAVERNKP